MVAMRCTPARSCVVGDAPSPRCLPCRVARIRRGLRSSDAPVGECSALTTPGWPRLIGSADAIVDGLLGLGATPPLRPPMDHLVELAATADGWRIAIDLPSGVDADTGRTDGPAFAADITVTIGAMKSGLLLADALAGVVTVAPIGMDPAALTPDALPDLVTLEETDADAGVPEPGAGDDKFSSGVLGVLAGSDGYPGAAVLCVGGAVRTRPGLVRYAGPQSTRGAGPLAGGGGRPPIRRTRGKVQAWVAGPGHGYRRRGPRSAADGARHRRAGAGGRRRAHAAVRAPRPCWPIVAGAMCPPC